MDDDCSFLGVFFEDIIEGYFPLRESLTQLLIRQSFDFAFVSFIFAPTFKNNQVRKNSTVSYHVETINSGMLTYFTALAELRNTEIDATGVASWCWKKNYPTGVYHFLTSDRLAEPAFVRGFGLIPKNGDETVSYNQEKSSGSNIALRTPSLKPRPLNSSHNHLRLNIKHSVINGKIVRGDILQNGNNIILVPKRLEDEVNQQNYVVNFENDSSNRAKLNKILQEIKI